MPSTFDDIQRIMQTAEEKKAEFFDVYLSDGLKKGKALTVFFDH